MNNYVDIAVLGIIALFVIFGFWRGFLRTLLSLAGTLIALAAAFFLAQTVANIIGGLGGLKDSLGGLVEGLFEGEVFNTPINLSDSESVASALASLGMPEFLLSPLSEAIVSSAPAGTSEISLAGYLGPMIVNFVLVVLSFIAIFLVVRIVMKFLEKFISGLLLNRTLRMGDRILGGAFGLVKSYFVLCLLLLVISLLAPSVPALDTITVMLEESSLAKSIVENNILEKLWLDYVYSFLTTTFSI